VRAIAASASFLAGGHLLPHSPLDKSESRSAALAGFAIHCVDMEVPNVLRIAQAALCSEIARP
jgi:hypothetical protein